MNTQSIYVLFIVVFAFIHNHSIEMFILFCVCRKAQEQVNHLSPNLLLLFAFLCSFSLAAVVVVVVVFGKGNERKTSERQIVYNVGLWARGVNGWMCIIIKRQGILLVVVAAVVACAALGIEIRQIIT